MIFRRCLALAAAWGLAAGAASAGDNKQHAMFDQHGLVVNMNIAPLVRPEEKVREGDDVQLQFRVSEAGEAGQSLSGLFPLAWLTKRKPDEAAPDTEACNYLIRGLLAGRLARSADVNLNEYLLVTLDENNSISIIDPQIESSKTKTLGIVSLTSKGEDFVLAPDRQNVLVTLPNQGRVAAADIFSRKARYLDPGGQPRRVRLQPDGRLAWIGDAAANAVHAIDVESFKLSASIEVGPGPHEFAFSADSRYVYVVSSAANRLSIIDSHALTLADQIKVARGAVDVGYSEYSGQIYVALPRDVIEVFDAGSLKRTASIKTEDEITHFAISPDQRYAMTLHRQTDYLRVIDLTSHAQIHQIKTRSEPNHLDFTESFAYVHHAGSGDAILLDLGSLRKTGEPVIAQVTMGQRPPAAGDHATIAPIVAPLPEGSGALVMNAADRSIYHFMEGMSAPMGAYQTYPWPARGVLISDRTLREVEKGLYQTEFRMPSAGTYTLPFLVPTSPQLFGCFTVEADRITQIERYSSLQLEPFDKDRTFNAGVPQTVDITLTDPDTGAPVSGLTDVVVLVMSGPRWQWRGNAVPLTDGKYRVDVTFPRAGQYMLMVASNTRKVKFGEVHSIVTRVTDAVDATTSLMTKD